MRAGVPWLIGLAVRQYIVLGRRADRERELRQVQRLAELKERATADRLALAQSLHDDLGHSLSLVALNLGRRSEEHTSELQSRGHLVCRLLLEKKKKYHTDSQHRIIKTNRPACSEHLHQYPT